MLPIHANANPFLTESEPLLDTNGGYTKAGKICLGVTISYYVLCISSIIALGILISKHDCSELKDDASLSCKNIQRNLETAQAYLIGLLVLPLVFGVIMHSISNPNNRE